jgi:hypothetical protein
MPQNFGPFESYLAFRHSATNQIRPACQNLRTSEILEPWGYCSAPAQIPGSESSSSAGRHTTTPTPLWDYLTDQYRSNAIEVLEALWDVDGINEDDEDEEGGVEGAQVEVEAVAAPPTPYLYLVDPIIKILGSEPSSLGPNGVSELVGRLDEALITAIDVLEPPEE